MIFLVNIETPTRGTYTLGFVSADDRRIAQKLVVEKLVTAGFPVGKIGQQVVDCSSLEIYDIHKVRVVPITEFTEAKAITLINLLLEAG